jgi:hypothetical protein
MEEVEIPDYSLTLLTCTAYVGGSTIQRSVSAEK